MRILLVEDDAMNRKVIRTMLEPIGVELLEAPDGPTALRLIEDAAFDAILMDLRMPGMDGFAVIREIRKRNDFKADAPIVVVTADTAVNIRGLSLEAGADGFLHKPILSADLYGAIGEAIVSRRRPSGARSA